MMAGQKKIPQRQCIGCQTVQPKKEMVRIVRSPAGEFSVDLTGKKPGRGAYLCRKMECFDAAVRGHRFARAFQGPVSPEIIDALKAGMFPAEG